MIKEITIKEGLFNVANIKKGQIQQLVNRWYLSCPRCGICFCLDHTVKVCDDNKVTIKPSIGCPQCKLHIFVSNGKIEYLEDMQ